MGSDAAGAGQHQRLRLGFPVRCPRRIQLGQGDASESDARCAGPPDPDRRRLGGLGAGSSRASAAPTGCQEGDDIALRIIQPSSGGGTYTATFNAAFDFGDYGAPVLTTGNSKWCIVSGKVISVDGSGNATKIAAGFWGGGS